MISEVFVGELDCHCLSFEMQFRSPMAPKSLPISAGFFVLIYSLVIILDMTNSVMTVCVACLIARAAS